MSKVVLLLVGLVALIAVSVAQFDSTQNWSNCPFNIESQNQCGSCYVFSTTEVLSDRVCIMTGQVPNQNQDSAGQISPEYYLDNNGANGGSPCNGGYPSDVMNFMANCGNGACNIPTADGVVSDSSQSSMTGGCYPYVAGSCEEGGGGSCPSWSYSQTATCQDGTTPWTFSGSLVAGTVSATPSAYQAEISQNGPIVGTMSVCQSFMSFYQNAGSSAAIYPGPCNSGSSDYLGGHAVKIVGWTQVNGVMAWKVANSWATGWGNNGYFYLQIGSDTCGIESNGGTTILVSGQTGASGTSTGAAGAAAAAAMALRSPVPGRNVVMSTTAPVLADYVNHYLAHVNQLSVYPHSLVSVNSAKSQVVSGVRVGMTLTTRDSTGSMFNHDAGVVRYPDMSLHTVKSVITPVPVSLGIVIGVPVAAGVFAIALIAGIVLYARRRAAQKSNMHDIAMPLARSFDNEA